MKFILCGADFKRALFESFREKSVHNDDDDYCVGTVSVYISYVVKEAAKGKKIC